jgi:hypothetical protein
MDLPELCKCTFWMQSNHKVTLIPYTLSNGYYHNQNGKSENILVGETKTDASGKFEINFVAKPFENTSKEQLPILNTLSLHPLRIVMEKPTKPNKC